MNVTNEARWDEKKARGISSSSHRKPEAAVRATKMITFEERRERFRRSYRELSKKYGRKKEPKADRNLTATMLVEENEDDFEDPNAPSPPKKTCLTQETTDLCTQEESSNQKNEVTARRSANERPSAEV
uniref:Uncharacterized protein n=1 Tax=Bursaphelenchus xylophilus TaxID=6326 RepID=A0A1I7SRT6_BURXY